MKIRRCMAAVIVFALLGCSLSGTLARANRPAAVGQYGELIELKEADVNGDGVPDKVFLVGRRFMPDSPFMRDIRVVVQDGTTGQIEAIEGVSIAGYEPRLFLGDFDGDAVPDIYIEAASGGSGGWYHHNILSFVGGRTRVLFDDSHNRGARIDGRFLDGYKVELTVNRKTITLDVRDRQADYLRLGLYDESGLLKKEVATMVTPYGKLVPIDLSRNGSYALQGWQRISGAYNADGLANVESVIKYADGIWQVIGMKMVINLNGTVPQYGEP